MQGCRKPVDNYNQGQEVVKHLGGLPVYEIYNIFGKLSLFCEFSRKLTGLLNRWDLSREQKPEHALSDHFFPSGGSREYFLALRNGQPVKPNALRLTDQNQCRFLNSCIKRTSLGSKTEASHSIAFKPRIPPMILST